MNRKSITDIRISAGPKEPKALSSRVGVLEVLAIPVTADILDIGVDQLLLIGPGTAPLPIFAPLTLLTGQMQ